MSRFALGLGVTLAVTQSGASLLPAQQHEHGGSPPDRLGRVRFPTSCSAAAQPMVERGVVLLHSFWYEEAGRAFEKAVEADSRCAMGYWGQAMSRLHPLWTPPTEAENAAGLAAGERAVRNSAPGTRERAWAEAVARYYARYQSEGPRPRMEAYERAMASLTERFPRDEEARIFHALALIALGQLDATDTTYARQRQAGDILTPLFERHPDHPGLAHYLIHAYDSPALAQRGVVAAGRYAAIAPSVPHAQHMPSHIYVRVGRWEDVVAANRRSAEAGRRFEEQQGMPGLWDQHAHALDYLVYGYLQLGDSTAAYAIVRETAGVTAVVPANSLTTDYALAAIPARYALERGDWAAAAVLSVRPAPAWRAAEAVTHFARAIGGARVGRPEQTSAEVDTLEQLEATLAAQGGLQAYWSGQVKIQRLAATAWAAWAAGDTATALREAAAAADLEDATEKHPVTPGPVLPARELYADLLLEAARPVEAREQYQAVLARQPGRARAIAGAARAGQHPEARQ